MHQTRWWWTTGSFLAAWFLPLAASAALVVDDFESGGTVNALGGAYATTADASSTVSPRSSREGHSSVGAVGWTYTLGNGTTYPWALLQTFLRSDGSTVGLDLSQYIGLRFWAKGNGQFVCQLPTTETAVEFNHFNIAFVVTADWALIDLPFSAFSQTWGTKTAWDPTAVWSIQWLAQGAAGTAGELTIDDVEFYGPDEELETPPVVFEAPKVNQVGYLADAPKIFRVTSPYASAGDPFEVKDANGNVVVRSTMAAEAIDDLAATGETVLVGDFSELIQAGRYDVEVAGRRSVTFEVGDSVYDGLYRDALRAFSLIRCGVSVDDATTGLTHASCHGSDATLRDDPATGLELTGGWHNAGDFGKWTHMTAISATYMMTLHDVGPAGARGLDAGIPESGDATADLLDEARWGLAFLLRMQRPDGSVLHKVDSEPNFAWGQSPDDDPNSRIASGASSIDAAVFVAALAHAARVFAPIDPEFAERCRTAAEASWEWLRVNPAVSHSDPYYQDGDASQEILWARCEWALLTRDEALMAEIETSLGVAVPSEVSWMAPQLLGVAALATSALVEPALQLAATEYLRQLAEGLEAKALGSGYGVALAPNEYYWGSNEISLHRAAALLLANDVLGEARYRDAALAQLDYLLGTNSLNQSFVTGYGTRTVRQPYHWSFYPMNTPIPGWASGGPNNHAAGADPPLAALIAKGTPPAKCYVDLGGPSGSWASNEGQTTENAALLFVTGHFASDRLVVSHVSPTQARVTGGGCSCSMNGGNRRYGLAAVAALFAMGLWLAVQRRRSKRGKAAGT